MIDDITLRVVKSVGGQITMRTVDNEEVVLTVPEHMGVSYPRYEQVWLTLGDFGEMVSRELEIDDE